MLRHPLLQARYAAGAKDVLQRFFEGTPLKKDDVIVEVSTWSAALPLHSLCLCLCLC